MDCLAFVKPWQIIELILCILAVLLISLLLAPIIRNWKKVQGNFLNIYTTNLLAISGIFSVISLVDTAIHLNFGERMENANSSEKNTSAEYVSTDVFSGFTTGLYFSLLLTQSCGVMLLAYGARKSYLAQRIGKLLVAAPRQQRTNVKCSIQSLWNRKKVRAKTLIFIFWVVTLGPSISVISGWKCNTIYPCLKNTVTNAAEKDCSYLWSPLKRTYVLTVSILSASTYVGAYGILIFTANQHFQELKNPTRNRAVVLTFCSLGASFKGCVILVTLSFIAFLPLMLLGCTDTILYSHASSESLTIAAESTKLLTFLYILPQPLVIVVYFSGIKTAIVNTFHFRVSNKSSTSLPSPDLNITSDAEMRLANLAYENTASQEVERLTNEA